MALLLLMPIGEVDDTSYEGYISWCKENGLVPVQQTRFTRRLSDNAVKLGLRRTNHIKNLVGNKVLSYDGVCLNTYIPYTGSTSFDGADA